MAIFQQGAFTLDANETPESIRKKRQMVMEIMMPYGKASNIGEGVGQLFNGIGVGMKNRQADKAEKAGMAQGATARDKIYSMLGGGMSQPASQQAPVSPNAGYEAGAVKREPLPQGDVAKRIYDGLVTRGLPAHVAVGALGNNQVESRLDPGINETNPLVAGSRGGYGINQWTGPRRREFEAYAASVGKPANDLDTQLDFTMKELRGTESGAMAKLMQTKTPEEAARVYSESFLRPGIPHLDKRIAAAQQYSGLMGDQPQSQGQDAIAAQMPAQQPQQAPQSDLQTMGLGGGALQGAFPQAPQGHETAQAQPMQGGMNVEMLARELSNPWLDDNTRAFAQQMLQREMQKSDPAYQQDQQMKQLQMQKLEAEIAKTNSPDARAKLGLNPQYGVDQQGNPVLLQIGEDGSAVQTQMPQGVTLSKEPIKLDAGTHFVLLDPITRQPVGQIPKNVSGEAAATATGKAGGEASMALPSAEAGYQSAVTAIDEVMNHPGLNSAVGTIQGRLPDALVGGFNSNAADFRSRVSQLQGKTFLQAFENLKGGGAISEVEGLKAEQAIGRLNQAVSEEDFKTALSDLKGILTRGIEATRAKAKMGGAQMQPNQVQAPAQNQGLSLDDLLKKY